MLQIFILKMIPEPYPQLYSWELFLNNKLPFTYVFMAICSILLWYFKAVIEMNYNLGLQFFLHIFHNRRLYLNFYKVVYYEISFEQVFLIIKNTFIVYSSYWKEKISII